MLGPYQLVEHALNCLPMTKFCPASRTFFRNDPETGYWMRFHDEQIGNFVAAYDETMMGKCAVTSILKCTDTSFVVGYDMYDRNEGYVMLWDTCGSEKSCRGFAVMPSGVFALAWSRVAIDAEPEQLLVASGKHIYEITLQSLKEHPEDFMGMWFQENFGNRPKDFRAKLDAHTCWKSGHAKEIVCLATIAVDTVASGSVDRTIKVWSVKRQACLHTLTGHKDTVRAIIPLPGERLASASDDNTVKLWSLRQSQWAGWRPKLEVTLTMHTDDVECLALLSDTTMASGSADHTIRLWDINTYRCLTTLTEHRGGVRSVIKLTDNTLASAGTHPDCSIKTSLATWQK
eukprot:COSAG01_NODE_3024_length_6708_cov_23.565138_6_plen_345_part_00